MLQQLAVLIHASQVLGSYVAVGERWKETGGWVVEMLSNLHPPSGPLWRTVCTNDRLHLPPIIFSHAPNYHALRGTYGTSDETLSQREEEEEREGEMIKGKEKSSPKQNPGWLDLKNPFTPWLVNRYETSEPPSSFFLFHHQPLGCHFIVLCESEARASHCFFTQALKGR